MNNKKICLDADGVLLNYNLAWGCIYNKIFPQAQMQVVNPYSYHAYEYWGFEPFDEETRSLFYSEFDKHGWDILPAYPGAAEAVKKLKEDGWQVYVVTSMPSQALQKRIDNLKNEGFVDFDDVIATGRHGKENPKKSTIDKIAPAYFVDDMMKNFDGIASSTECVYINPNPNYRNQQGFLQSHSLSSFVDNHIFSQKKSPYVFKK